MAKILIVDDENNIRLMLRLALQASGHTIETASDGPEALDKFGEDTFDLVLLDQRMPAMDGLDVLRLMRSQKPDSKIIMVTAFGTVDLAMEAQRAGATNFLRKPFTTDVLRGAVEAALQSSDPAPPLGTPASLQGIAVNGFRLEASQTQPEQSKEGSFSHHFDVFAPEDVTTHCAVVFPPYFVELVKAHTDRESLKENNRFWLWLGEEALANYLWQNATPPPGGTLVLEELSSNLRRWMDAVLVA
ncbi:regulatory protein AtoC [Abditibacteriota bacterium]|nr:regulatory protein AtoC [Abditibacteriota bacterium]